MVIAVILVASLALVGTSVGQQVPSEECKKEIESFHQCMKENHKPPSPPAKVNECLTKSGCNALPDQAGQQGPGGRGGPSNNASGQCFQKVHQQMQPKMQKCLSDNNVNLPPKPNGEHGPGGPGGPGGHHLGGPPPGGPGGPGGPGEMVLQQCGNDNDKAKRVRQCMQQNKPSEAEGRAKFDQMCAAEKNCKAQNPISKQCKQEMAKIGQAMCQCMVSLKVEFMQAVKEACPNAPPPGSGGPPPRQGGSQGNQQPDCSKPHQSPCEEGYEAFKKKMEQHRPPQGAGGSQPGQGGSQGAGGPPQEQGGSQGAGGPPQGQGGSQGAGGPPQGQGGDSPSKEK